MWSIYHAKPIPLNEEEDMKRYIIFRFNKDRTLKNNLIKGAETLDEAVNYIHQQFIPDREKEFIQVLDHQTGKVYNHNGAEEMVMVENEITGEYKAH